MRNVVSNSARLVLIAVVILFVGVCPVQSADVQAELNAATADLFAGRVYLVGFPISKTRNQVRDEYLQVTTNGTPAGPGRFGLLQRAANRAVAIRTDPASAEAATLAQLELAQRIAWEAEEAILQGQLIAGNGNLLKGLRVAFPNTSGSEKPGGEDTLPAGCPGPAANGDPDGSYKGSKITDLCYARLHFMRGVVSALDFASSDSTGELRDPSNNPFPQYTLFSTPELPDPNFPPNSQSQTMGYLLGNILDRYGKAVTGIGDRLWRAAYFDAARAPGGSRSSERPEMLEAAMRELQKGAHAQFLASLPLAATLDDGQGGSINEFQLCRVDQARFTVANSSVFIDRIRRGEIPKLDSFALNASISEINQKISLINTLKNETAIKFGFADAAIWKTKQSEEAMISAAQELRSQFSGALLAATKINPDDGRYSGLATAQGRENYRHDFYARLEAAVEAPSTSSLLTDGSEVGQVILQMHRAFAEIDSARNRVDSIPQQIQTEELRVGAINGVLVGTQDQISAYQLGIGIANSVSVTASASVGYPPPNVSASVATTVNPGAIVVAVLQNEIGRAQVLQEIAINDINANATIRNLLLQQHQYTLDLKTAAIQGQLAVAQLNATIARIERLIEDHIYYQDSNGSKWWSDAALVFEQEKAELDYQNALGEYVRQLYVLSQMLAARWGEPYENPYFNRDRVPVTLGSELYDDFTQPESIFNVYEATQADNFFAALKAWDQTLRNADRLGGDITGLQYRVSLRQDIFGLSEVVYDPALQAFVIDSAARTNSIRLFRALLLRNAQPETSPFWLRLEFPAVFNQRVRSREVPGVGQPLLMPISRDDWNLRITDISARLLGNNVAQDTFNRYRIELYQYGNIEIPRYFPRSTIDKAILSFNLPLYYAHPAEGSTSAYKFTIFAGLGSNPGAPVSVADMEPTPYCDNYVLLIERSANERINLHNIEDIEFTFTVRGGRPTGFAW